MLVKWKMQVDAECALCGGNKDTELILCCPDPPTCNKWAQSITKLCKWLNIQLTPTALQNSNSSSILGQWKRLESASYLIAWTGQRPHRSTKYWLETVYGKSHLHQKEGGTAFLLQRAETQKDRMSLGRTAEYNTT
jgi:hypothetical protein